MRKNLTPVPGLLPETPAAQPAEEKKPKEKTTEKNTRKSLLGWFRTMARPVRIVVLVSFLTLVLGATLTLAWYCWLVWLPDLWAWGFRPFSWRSVFSVLGAIMLIGIPIYPFALTAEFLSDLVNTYNDQARRERRIRLDALEEKRERYEQDMRKADTLKLVPLITFSKLELETYYDIGLRHSRRSYHYSIMAMWIGFLVILAGLVLFVVPIPQINTKFVHDSSLKVLSVGSGLVIELISALFLWIYKSSSDQLTYFYNRQIYIHNALFAFRIADTMQHPDETKHMIVGSILDIPKTPAAAAKKSRVKTASPVSLSA